MKNTKKNSKAEYLESWDAGTYQTGNITPPKRSSLLVSVLLMLVIFLGGIASALGLVNISLLMALQETQPDPTVSLQLQAGTEGSDSLLTDDVAPEIPEGGTSMMLVNPNVKPAEEITDAMYQTRVNHASVTVSGGDTLSGTGLVLTQDGYILTYAHLVEHQERIYVTLCDGSRYRASVVGIDALTDLAVLYIRATGLVPAQFSDCTFLSDEGSRVWVNRNNTLGGGALCRNRTTIPLGSSEIHLMQTSAATNLEEGALWNSNCQVIGILSPCISQYFQEEDGELAWAIPSNTVKQIVDHILETGHVPGRPSLEADVEEVTDLYRNYWKLPTGLHVTATDNSALMEGDILVSLDGCPVTTCQELYKILFSSQPGQTLEATVIRNGKPICIRLTLNEDDWEE